MADTDSQRYQHEINHLKETINALRDELEKKQVEINRRLQSSKQAASEQIKQLERTIDQMRLRLEEEHSARKTDVQKATESLKHNKFDVEALEVLMMEIIKTDSSLLKPQIKPLFC